MILNRQKKVRVALAPLKEFLDRVQKEAGIGRAELTICFVSNAEMARMNLAFRRKKGPTDVLSFPAVKRRRPGSLGKNANAKRGDAEGTWKKRKKWQVASDERRAREYQGKAFLGDIAIAPEVARRYAKEHGRTLRDELLILILHGVLHLLGYDHETDRGQMDRLERQLRRRFGLT